jgi:hypothetical protein
MGYDAKIRGRYWRPLGTVEYVQQEIVKAFPGVTLVVQQDPKLFATKGEYLQAASQIRTGGPLGPIMRLALLLGAFRPLKFPYVEGYVSGDDYAVEFFLGSEPIVRKIRLTLYGDGLKIIGPQFDTLLANTGWLLK